MARVTIIVFLIYYDLYQIMLHLWMTPLPEKEYIGRGKPPHASGVQKPRTIVGVHPVDSHNTTVRPGSLNEGKYYGEGIKPSTSFLLASRGMARSLFSLCQPYAWEGCLNLFLLNLTNKAVFIHP